jgi:hypothetical protein
MAIQDIVVIASGMKPVITPRYPQFVAFSDMYMGHRIFLHGQIFTPFLNLDLWFIS